MVPCYKEELEIIRRTLMAAYDATLPEGCNRTIYLCDDGKDPRKRKWIASMGPEFVGTNPACCFLMHIFTASANVKPEALSMTDDQHLASDY